jgi:hypothetical protein
MAPTNSRIKIDIVEIRAQDVQPGDIVNRRGHQRDGWIEVTVVSAMQSGELLIADESERLSFTSAPARQQSFPDPRLKAATVRGSNRA